MAEELTEEYKNLAGGVFILVPCKSESDMGKDTIHCSSPEFSI